MSIYMTRLFPKSNSSFSLSKGQALQASVTRLRDDMFLVDSGLGSPRLCKKDELTRVPNSPAVTKFQQKIGYMGHSTNEPFINGKVLERCFIDLVAGEPKSKEAAALKFNNLAGSTDVVAGEPHLLLPRKFRQHQIWMELNKAWRTNSLVRGFIIDKVKGGWSVAIGGYVAFFPYRHNVWGKLRKDSFRIQSIDNRSKRVVLENYL